MCCHLWVQLTHSGENFQGREDKFVDPWNPPHDEGWVIVGEGASWNEGMVRVLLRVSLGPAKIVVVRIAAIFANPHLAIGTHQWIHNVSLVGAVYNVLSILYCTSNAAIEWSSS